MNYKKVIPIIILTLIFIIGLCCIYIQDKEKSKEYNQNENNSEEFLYQEELKKLHEEEQKKLMKEINDEKTKNYIVKETSDDTVSLEYAYITEEYTKIKLSYTLDKQVIGSNLKKDVNENELIRQFEDVLEEAKIEKKDTWIETSNKKKITPERTSDGDGGRTLTSPTGIYEWYDTFPLTTKEATENLTLYFTNANNNIVILKLELKK